MTVSVELVLERSPARAVVTADGVDLAIYEAEPATPREQSPRPYLHPMQTRAGRCVTDFQPADHLWHHGLSMTCAPLSGHMFWGGRTYVRDQGYVLLDNHGRQLHRGWDAFRDAAGATGFDQRVGWVADDGRGETLIEEARSLRFQLGPGDSAWTLDWSMALRNVTGRTLAFGSPTTEGRPNAGYGGLMWRGPLDAAGGEILADAGRSATADETLMGQTSEWLAYRLPASDGRAPATILWCDHPRNPRHPARWFTRCQRTPMVAPVPMFARTLDLSAGETLSLRYRVVVFDGMPDAASLASRADAWVDEAKA